MRVRLAWSRRVDDHRVTVLGDATNQTGGNLVSLNGERFPHRRHLRDDTILDAIVRDVRAIEVIADRGGDKFEQFVLIGFGEQGFGYVEQRAQRLHARGVSLALIVVDRLPHRLHKFFAFFEWLEKQTIHALPKRADCRLNCSEAGHHQHGNIRLDDFCA